MAYHGSERCNGCSGEDCVCCEVYLEEQADQRNLALYGPEEDDPWEDDDCCDDNDDDDDPDPGDVDGDHESGLASAGFGTDEDYGDWGYESMYED